MMPDRKVGGQHKHGWSEGVAKNPKADAGTLLRAVHWSAMAIASNFQDREVLWEESLYGRALRRVVYKSGERTHFPVAMRLFKEYLKDIVNHRGWSSNDMKEIIEAILRDKEMWQGEMFLDVLVKKSWLDLSNSEIRRVVGYMMRANDKKIRLKVVKLLGKMQPTAVEQEADRVDAGREAEPPAKIGIVKSRQR